MMPLLNIANIVEATEAEGPGLRFVVWVQGCLKRCQGCCNPELLKIKPTHIQPKRKHQQKNTTISLFHHSYGHEPFSCPKKIS